MKDILKTAVCGTMVLMAAGAFADAAAEKARQAAWRALDKSAQDLRRKDFTGGFANYWHDNIDAARALYESALTNALFTNAQKIDALRKAAQMHLEATRDDKAALAKMECAFKLPDLTDEDRKRAAAAMLDLKRALRLAPPDPNSQEARKAAYDKLSLDEKAKLARGGTDENGKPKMPEGSSVYDYFNACLAAGYDEYFRRVPAMLSELESRFPKINYWNTAWGNVNHWYFNRFPAKAQWDRRFRASFVSMMETAPTNHAISAEALFNYTNGSKGLEEKCAGYAEKVLLLAAADERASGTAGAPRRPKVNPKTVSAAKKYLLLHKAGADSKKIVAACRAFLAGERKSDDRIELAKLIAEQANLQLKAGREKIARELWDERAKIAPEKSQAKLDCPYWKNAPHDIRGIVESDFYKKAPKGLFDRRYGDNLKFLIETDSAITSRQLTTDKGEKFRPTEIFAFCDARGVHILLRAFQDNMADVKEGNAGVPGYESYLATGVDDPYHCLMLDTKEGAALDSGFTTQYDNGSGYRNLSEKRGNIQYSNLYLDDSVATLISVLWGSASASIPSRSPAWYFEAIHWAHGGLSWGGSKSVHWRSTFGELKFTGVDAEALAAIERTVLRTARQTMCAEKSPRQVSAIEQWMDPVLGDQEFYLAVVKPYVTRIDADLAKITRDSTPAEIAAVFATGSVDDAINIRYRIAELRSDWLKEKMTK